MDKEKIPYQEMNLGEYSIKKYVNDEIKILVDKGYTLTI